MLRYVLPTTFLTSGMTLFALPNFSRRPSFTIPFAQTTNTFLERGVEEKSVNVALQPDGKVTISGPRSLNHTLQLPAIPKRPTAPRRFSRSQSRARLMVPHKATATQTLTLTSATSTSSLAKDIEDVDINTIKFSALPQANPPSAYFCSPSPRRPSSPAPPTPGEGRRAHHGMGQARHFPSPIPTTQAETSSINPKIRSSTSPPSAGTPSTPKRARLTVRSRLLDDAQERRDVVMNLPARPESPTPGSQPTVVVPSAPRPVEVIRRKPTPFRPPTEKPASFPPAKKAWQAISSSTTFSSTPTLPLSSPISGPAPDDDDDIIVFRMEVEKPPSPDIVTEIGMNDGGACNPPIQVDTLTSNTQLDGWEESMPEDLRDQMLQLSTVLAKRVRKRINPSLSDDVPPPIPSPVKLRQAIATMFLEHGNSFPPLRRRSPPPGKPRSRLSVVEFFPGETPLHVS